MEWIGKHSDALLEETPFLDLEGAFRSGKTTIGLWKELNAILEYPGIHTMLSRWTDDAMQGILKPVWRQILRDHGMEPVWHGDEEYDEFPNGSRAYLRSLKTQDQVTRYSRFRGLTLSRAYIDQAEEAPEDVADEVKARLSQPGYPHQMVLTPNAVDENHWIARKFPEDGHIGQRRYIYLSLYDNAHNLSPETIRNIEETYPPGHVKHRPAVLGLRGLNIIGDPVYGAVDASKPETAAFSRKRHERSLDLDPTQPLYESLDFGKHHPCVVWAQYTPYGELRLLGGLLGQQLFLEDFAPIVQHYRQRWFPAASQFVTCCDPAGSHANSQGLSRNAIELLRELGFPVTYKEDSNTPQVRLAMIERLAGRMRRRSPRGEEAFLIDNTRWLRIGAGTLAEMRFLADGFEAGYVWDEHMISVANKQVRRPKKDGWYEHGQNCCEYLEHNFGSTLWTPKQVRQSRRDVDPYDAVRPSRRRGGLTRGGY